jgi:thiol-disulfide isomerase/thioredoxin
MADPTPSSRQTAPISAQTSAQAAASTQASTQINVQVRNLLIALAAVALAVLIALGVRTQGATATLGALAEKSVPLNQALVSGQPTLVEFYADWCTSCQAMAGDMADLKQTNPNINFVMLNVDNTKWLPEVLKYQVDGIPHFVFLDKAGQTVAQVIGEQPKPIMAANLAALGTGEGLPYAQQSGQTTAFSAPVRPDAAGQTDPRSHGAQVKASS